MSAATESGGRGRPRRGVRRTVLWRSARGAWRARVGRHSAGRSRYIQLRGWRTAAAVGLLLLWSCERTTHPAPAGTPRRPRRRPRAARLRWGCQRQPEARRQRPSCPDREAVRVVARVRVTEPVAKAQTQAGPAALQARLRPLPAALRDVVESRRSATPRRSSVLSASRLKTVRRSTRTAKRRSKSATNPIRTAWRKPMFATSRRERATS